MKLRRFVWTLIPLLWGAFTLRVWRLDAQSLWYDEGYSLYLGAHLPLPEALDLTLRDVVPPLYYLLLRVWLPLVGTSEYGVRFLSVLFGVVGVAAIAQIGRYILRIPRSSAEHVDGLGAGLLAGALAALAPVLIWLSQDARMYGLLVTWGLLASWGLLRALSDRGSAGARRRGWVLFVLAALAALYTHTVSAFWLVGQLAFAMLVIWRSRNRGERVRQGLLVAGLLFLAYVPWMIVALVSYRTNAGYWPGYLPPMHLWRTAWETFVGGGQLSHWVTTLAAVWFGLAALLGGALLLLKRPRAALYLLCYLILPLLAMGVAFQHTPKLAARYPTAMVPALFLLLAAGTAVAFRMSRFVPLIAALFLMGVASISLLADANLYTDPQYAKEDWRGLATYLREHRAPDETVLLVSGHAFPVFAYYYGWEGWHALPEDVQLDVNHVLDYPSIALPLSRQWADVEGAWLVSWQEEVVDPTGLVPALLGDLADELPTPTFAGATAGDRVTLRHFRFRGAARVVDELPIQNRLNETVAPGLNILGYTLPVRSEGGSDEPLPADATIAARVFWQALEPLRGAYAASLRLYDRLGQEWARRDAFLAGSYLPERWPVGSPVMGVYTVTLPLGTPPGVYSPTLMVYRSDETFETVVLPSLVITRPLTPPSRTALALGSDSPIHVSGPAGAPLPLTLVGVGVDQRTVTPCQDWAFSLAWQVTSQPDQAYRLRLSAGSSQIEMPLAADFPTTRWRPGDLWRTRHHLPIDCRALDGDLPITLELLHPDGRPASQALHLVAISVAAGRHFAPPTDLTATLDVQLPDIGTLLGYRLNTDRVRPGENLEVTLYWRADRETDHNYSVFVHLASDQVWAQHDGWPADGKKPTSTWAKGEVVADRHVVPVGDHVPTGSFDLLVGMYDAATLEPLAAMDREGYPVAGGRITLNPIAVSNP